MPDSPTVLEETRALISFDKYLAFITWSLNRTERENPTDTGASTIRVVADWLILFLVIPFAFDEEAWARQRFSIKIESQ